MDLIDNVCNMELKEENHNIKIVVLYNQSLFSAGVEARLLGVDQFEVSHIETSEGAVLERLGDLSPDVIIVDRNDTGLLLGELIPQIRKKIHDFNLISLDLNSNEVNIYRQERRLALSGIDLIDAINDMPYKADN